MTGTGLAQQPAQDLVPGNRYAGGTRVQDAARGLSFTLPSHWAGHIPVDSEALLLNADDRAGIGIVAVLDQMTPESLTQRLEEPQDFGGSVVLQLSQALEQDGLHFKASYLSGNVVGRARALLGPDGLAVVYFFAGPVAEARTYEELLEGLTVSTRFGPVSVL